MAAWWKEYYGRQHLTYQERMLDDAKYAYWCNDREEAYAILIRLCNSEIGDDYEQKKA